MRYVFEVVTVQRAARGACPTCGKRRTRSHRVEHTVNPYNRNPDGTVKSRDEVRAAAEAEADTWTPSFTCMTHGTT